MGFFNTFSQQFRKPVGFRGYVAGMLMAVTTGSRNEWTLSLLEIRPEDRILEIGYGPGVGIFQASRRIQGGAIVGIDPSETMRKQAERRNCRAIRQGKVRLVTGNIEEWPAFEHSFTKIFSVNSAPFWTDRVRVFQKLRGWLEPGGRIATTYQPVGKHAPGLDDFADRLIDELNQAGFVRVRRETKPFRPAPAVCIIAEKAKPFVEDDRSNDPPEDGDNPRSKDE